MRWVHQDPHFSSISSTWEPYSDVFQPFWWHSRFLTEVTLVSDGQTDIPNLVLFPIQVPIKHTRIVFPKTFVSMDVHINFVREILLDLQCSPKISAICVVEDVSKHLTLEFWAIWEHSPMLPEYRTILHQLLVRHNMVILQERLFVQQKLHRPQSRLLQCISGARLCLYTSVIVIPTPHFEVTYVH